MYKSECWRGKMYCLWSRKDRKCYQNKSIYQSSAQTSMADEGKAALGAMSVPKDSGAFYAERSRIKAEFKTVNIKPNLAQIIETKKNRRLGVDGILKVCGHCLHMGN